MSAEKLVLAIVDDLPIGLAMNACALLGMSLGRQFPGVVGADLPDGSGAIHPGISTRNVPVLTASPERIIDLAGRARREADVAVVDITDTAQQARTYADYAAQLASRPTGEHRILGLALCGPESLVRSLTGDLSLYR